MEKEPRLRHRVRKGQGMLQVGRAEVRQNEEETLENLNYTFFSKLA